MNKNDIISMSKTIKEYYKKNKTYPKSVLIRGETITIQQATYLMCCFILDPSKDYSIIKVGGASNSTGDRCNRQCNKATYTDMAKRCKAFIDSNKKLPNYVVIKDNQKCSIILFIYQLSKIVSAYNNKLPNSVLINSADLQTTPKRTYSEEIYDYFVAKFGKVTTIDGALSKIQNKGYGFYYNNKMTNKQVINALADPNAEKPNCTDVHQMLWHIAKVLGYDVRAIHVWCNTSNVGHIRIQVKHPKNTDGYWINRDGACVIDGGAVDSIWCSNGTYIATNPQWFMDDLNK